MNDKKSSKELENRRSRWIWEADDIVIIKNPDQETKGKKGKPATPPSPDPTPSEPKKDDDQQDR